MIKLLEEYWVKQHGFILLHPYDLPMGAATFHPKTFFTALDTGSASLAYIQPCRRPSDSRTMHVGDRLQYFHQYQVIIKPYPKNIKELYLKSLQYMGLNYEEHDYHFKEDNWQSPTLGAYGKGWEVILDGTEISQITNFEKVGNVPTEPIAELAYGLERIALVVQDKENIYQLKYHREFTYKDIYEGFNQIELYSPEMLDHAFADLSFYIKLGLSRAKAGLINLAYDSCIQANYLFNIVAASGTLNHEAKVNHTNSLRELSNCVALAYIARRAK